MSEKITSLLAKLRSGDRFALSKCITLIESDLAQDRRLSLELLAACEKLKPTFWSIAITGSPGVGKSTFIEVLGKSLSQQGDRLAILAIDPTSQVSQGSILGDKTRMAELSQDDHVFIRPSSNRLNYGGVAPTTWETMLLCATAGFDHILIETVGVGQSEVDVAQLADVVLLLLQPGAGDELQGVKRGILEIAHILLVTKDDGQQKVLADQTYHIFQQNLITVDHWQQVLLKFSALEDNRILPVQQAISRFRATRSAKAQRERDVRWLRWKSEQILLALLRSKHGDAIMSLSEEISAGRIGPVEALQELISDLKLE